MTRYYPGPSGRSWEVFREQPADLMKAVTDEPLTPDVESEMVNLTDSLRWAVEAEIERALRERYES